MDLIAALYVVSALFWLWCLVDVLRHEFKGQNKIIWLLTLLFLNVLGALLYVLIGRSQRINVPLKEEIKYATPHKKEKKPDFNEDYWQRRIKEMDEHA